MRYLHLVWSNLSRKKVRSGLTLLSIVVAFVLFGYLVAIEKALSMGVDLTGADRLVVRHKVSIIQLLPEKYARDIEQIPGVKEVAHQTWFGGIYQDPRNFFPQLPVDPERYLSMFPEFLLPAEQREAWLSTRTGAIVGRTTAERFGWKIGDRIPIQPTIWRKKDGPSTWEFDLVGIYDGAEKGTDTTQFLFRYDYFDEGRVFGQGWVGWFTIRVDDPEHAAEVAERVDAHFANSSAETKTETEKAFAGAFAKQVGNIRAIFVAILSAVFFTILVVAGNTLAQAVRERKEELAVMKALGFSHGHVLALVLAESCFLAGLGGGAGLAVASILISQGDPTGGFLPIFYFPRSDLLLGVVCVLLLGFAAGILPALQAMRLSMVEALRRM